MLHNRILRFGMFCLMFLIWPAWGEEGISVSTTLAYSMQAVPAYAGNTAPQQNAPAANQGASPVENTQEVDCFYRENRNQPGCATNSDTKR